MVQVGSPLVDLSASGGVELEGPQEVGCLLEGGSAGVDFVDEVFHADDVLLAQHLLDGEVRDQRDSLSQDLAVASLVDQLRDDASGWVSAVSRRLPEGDVWLDLPQQVLGGQVSSDEHGVVDLSQSEELEDLLLSRSDGIDTLGSDDQEHLGFGWDEDASAVLGGSVLVDDLSLRSDESLVVGLASLEPFSLSGLDVGSSGFSRLLQFVGPLVCSLELLLVRLRNWSPRVTG